jgi:carbamoyl-phosphate synthase small subunit
MNILLINNYKNSGDPTTHYPDLMRSLAGHNVVEQHYKPGIEFADAGMDLVILSGGGGEGQEINDTYRRLKLWYEDQMEFILTTKKPIIGICMGFEVIARAYGQKVEKLNKGVEGFKQLETTSKGKQAYKTDWLSQDEAHSWGVANAPTGFEVLAKSDTGLEIIRHQKRPIIATQFHPEALGGTLNLTQLLSISSF